MAGIISAPEGTLVLGEKGEIDGDIFVNITMIYGSVRGDIHATRKVELRRRQSDRRYRNA